MCHGIRKNEIRTLNTKIVFCERFSTYNINTVNERNYMLWIACIVVFNTVYNIPDYGVFLFDQSCKLIVFSWQAISNTAINNKSRAAYSNISTILYLYKMWFHQDGCPSFLFVFLSKESEAESYTVVYFFNISIRKDIRTPAASLMAQ